MKRKQLDIKSNIRIYLLPPFLWVVSILKEYNAHYGTLHDNGSDFEM